jgi:hypothetical protein
MTSGRISSRCRYDVGGDDDDDDDVDDDEWEKGTMAVRCYSVFRQVKVVVIAAEWALGLGR